MKAIFVILLLAGSLSAQSLKCDGVTDDTAALQAAWASGGEIDLPAGKCYAPNGLNFSTAVPQWSSTRVIRGAGKMLSQIVTNNANIGIDLGGVVNLKLQDFMLTDIGAAPHIGIAKYRAAVSNASGGQTFDNVAILGNYTIADLYSVASENNSYRDVDIYAYGPGVGVSINQSNCLGMTGQALDVVAAGSDTVNHFYSGMVVANQPASGGGVFFCSGAADDVLFEGTYFYSTLGHFSVGFGQGISSFVQGSKTFRSVRFEGQGDAIQINASGVDLLTIDGGSTFGELAPGIDINQINSSLLPGASGLRAADIHGNAHMGRGLNITAVTASHISVNGLYGSPSTKTIITVPQNGFISESNVQADGFVWGANTSTPGSVITQSDNVTATGGYKQFYGPKSPSDPYGSAGSVIVLQPFGVAPSNPTTGELVTADCRNWQPVKCSAPTLVFWNGSAWQKVGN